jgi:EAL and modified HD-GYP domain-containing signal transduction protein
MDELAKLLQRFPAPEINNVVFVSRQPIYTSSARLFAYQLLYRRDVVEQALLEKADNELFLNMFLDLESLVGGSRAFISVPRPFILQDYCRVLPKEKVVLEISPDVCIDETVLLSLRTLSELGYKLALDDFDNTEQNPALELANYVNLNFARLTHEDIFSQFSTLVQSKVKPIAINIETYEEFEMAKAMGFEYFRGSCFNRPKISTPMRVPINRLSTMQLVLKLQNPELSSEELEKIVSQDLAISYKLLRFVNSAALSLSRNIESIKHAIQMVGTARIRAWASLLLLTKLDEKPAEVLVTALVRAKMSEGLAVAMGVPKPDSYYMVGLFSLVDALLNITMPEAILLLPFPKQVRDALLSHEGQLGSVLRCVIDYENGNWDGVCRSNVDAATIRQCYLDAISAAQKMPTDSH